MRKQAGFTLIEMMITMSVIVIGFAGLLALHLSIVGGNAASARSAEAVAIAERTLEQLRSETISGMTQDLTGSAATALPLVGVAMPTATGRNGMTYARKATVEELTAASPDLIRIHVDVSWTDDGAAPNAGHDHSVSLELVRTRQEGL